MDKMSNESAWSIRSRFVAVDSVLFAGDHCFSLLILQAVFDPSYVFLALGANSMNY